MNSRLLHGVRIAAGLASLWLIVQSVALASDIKIDPAHSVIVVREKSDALIDYAATELQTHLKLITGIEIPVRTSAASGQFPFYIGARPDNDQAPLALEEARWRVTEQGVWLYGRDEINRGKEPDGGYVDTRKSITNPALNSRNQAGSLFAVYEFLEAELGVRWIEPGAAGIVYHANPRLMLQTKEGNWVPQLTQRHLRAAYEDNLRTRALEDGVGPKDLQFSTAEYQQRQYDEAVWMRRMRRGKTIDFSYGHAFTKWWAKYGETHPEYFALGKNGKRGPASPKVASLVKMCVSNEDLIKQIVADHYAAGGGHVINACENDSRDFCRCDQCRALDVRLPGEESLDVDDSVLTDRYVHFTNAIQREARKRDPQAQVVFYAYSRYNFPPRREKLDDGVIIFLLPNSTLTDSDIKTYYEAWKAANAKEAFLRPNDLNQDTGIPLGFEEHFFRKFKLADQYLKLKGTDFDTCFGFWPVSGIADYILIRGFYRPDRSFEDWENEYYAAFGGAEEEVRAYNQYWRQVWNKRVMTNLPLIEKYFTGIKLLRTRMANMPDLLYSDADFDRTDAFLAKAMKKNLNEADRRRVETLVLANQHNRLTYLATKANRLAATASPDEQKQATQALYDFRKQHRMDLNINWELLLWMENSFDDSAGFLRLMDKEPAGEKSQRLKDDQAVRALRTNHERPLF